MTTQILTPVGRLVQGDCFKPNTKDADGNPLIYKRGPKMGEPREDYFFSIAILKTEPSWAAVWEKIKTEAIEGFPQLAPQLKEMNYVGENPHLQFSFKITDGDSDVPNQKGFAPNSKPGFPGCWIVSFTSAFAPECYTAGGAKRITESEQLKRGYYVRIGGNVRPNGSEQRPGVFMNHSMVELVAYGEEISSRQTGEEVFGNSPVARLPEGASATPIASDFLKGGGQFKAPDGNVYTEQELLAKGWGLEQINGLPQI